MISIVTRYRKQDSTLAAIALARHFTAVVKKYEIINFDTRINCIDPAHDNKVRSKQLDKLFDETNHIIWTSPVDLHFLEMAKKRGIRTTLYTSWEQIAPYDSKAIDAYTHILLPTVDQAIKLKDRFKLRNVAVMPYDSGYPHTVKTNKKRITRIFLSLYGSQLQQRVDLSVIALLGNLLKDLPDLSLTIACAGGLGLHTKRELKTIKKGASERLNVLWNCPWWIQAAMIADHDLTVWPTRVDGLGIIGNTSLAMGTPVITWNASPMNEHLSPDNSVLVSCDVEQNWLGVTRVIPDYTAFNNKLRELLVSSAELNRLQMNTCKYIDARRDDFIKGWHAILPTA